MAREVYQQKLEEAQEIAEVVTDAECRIGELLKRTIPHEGGRKKQSSMSDRLADIGLTKNQSSQFQIMADHPEAVERAKQTARREGTVLSRNAVLGQIAMEKPKRKPLIQEAIDGAKERQEKRQAEPGKSIIDFADLKQEKEDEEIIKFDFKREMDKMLNAIDAFALFRERDAIEKTMDTMTAKELEELWHKIQQRVQTLNQIQAMAVRRLD